MRRSTVLSLLLQLVFHVSLLNTEHLSSQGIITEGEGSVQLTSSFYSLVRARANPKGELLLGSLHLGRLQPFLQTLD
jgi:hypothetical protein